ncbi:MAG: diaminopimelate epimerase [Parvularculaceae bacterium]
MMRSKDEDEAPAPSSQSAGQDAARRLSAIPFVKMNGLGNDFVILDLRDARTRRNVPDEYSALARRIADRQNGVGCDQLITIAPPDDPQSEDARMGIWNADGGEVEACGNAARCVAWLLFEESGREKIRLNTLGGIIEAQKAGPLRVSVDMGAPKFDWRDIPMAEATDTIAFDLELDRRHRNWLGAASAVNLGNPHCVFFVADAPATPVEELGPLVERNPLFPARVNVSFAEIVTPSEIILRVWERGAGATRACGTAACATLVAAVRNGLAGRKAAIALPGGPLDIEWRAQDNHVIMTGAVEFEGAGEIPARLLTDAKEASKRR